MKIQTSIDSAGTSNKRLELCLSLLVPEEEIRRYHAVVFHEIYVLSGSLVPAGSESLYNVVAVSVVRMRSHAQISYIRSPKQSFSFSNRSKHLHLNREVFRRISMVIFTNPDFFVLNPICFMKIFQTHPEIFLPVVRGYYH